MTTHHRAIVVCPVAHGNAINRVMNKLWDDSGDNLSRPLSSNGQPPATLLYDSRDITVEELAVLLNLRALVLSDEWVPDGGWPVEIGSHDPVSKQDALDALAATQVYTVSGEDASALAGPLRASVFTTLGVQIVEEEEG